MIAASQGNLKLVKEIVGYEAKMNLSDSDSRTALHYAIDNQLEFLDVVSLLIEKGAGINKATRSEGFTPLIIAVNRGHKAIVRKLIDSNAKLDAKEYKNNNTALHIAC